MRKELKLLDKNTTPGKFFVEKIFLSILASALSFSFLHSAKWWCATYQILRVDWLLLRTWFFIGLNFEREFNRVSILVSLTIFDLIFILIQAPHRTQNFEISSNFETFRHFPRFLPYTKLQIWYWQDI